MQRFSKLRFVDVVTNPGHVYSVKTPQEVEVVARVFESACEESITIYDASYLYYAIQNKLTLVTNDEKLLEKARRYVNAIRSRDLA